METLFLDMMHVIKKPDQLCSTRLCGWLRSYFCLLSANHSTKNGCQSPIHNSIAEWVVVWFDLFIYSFLFL